jgi:large subunit ribosomal protein L21
MYAIAEDRRRQLTLRVGQSVLLHRNSAWQTGSEIVLDKVCLLGGEPAKVGTPYVEGAAVVLEVKREEKGKKLVIGKYRRRKNYRRRTGFRPVYLRCVVKEIRG